MQLFEYLKFVFWDKEFLKNSFNAARIPVTLNILGHKYFLETHILTTELVYLIAYSDDLQVIPESDSNIVVFLSLNFYSRGKIETIGRVFYKERLAGDRIGLWIQFIDLAKEDRKLLQKFLTIYYAPRYSVRFEALLKQNHQELAGEAINLSLNGVFLEIDTEELIVQEQEYILYLYPEDREIQVRGIITWINSGKLYDKPYGCGIKFLHSGHSHQEIAQYLATLRNRSELVR